MPAERKPLARRTGLRRSRWGKPQSISRIEQELEAKLALGFWQETVRRPCRVCGAIHGLEAHHVIAKSVLKRELASKGKPCPVGFIWDPRNGMSLCGDCHDLFTNRAISIARRTLSMANEEFAQDHGLEWRLDRDYGPRHNLAGEGIASESRSGTAIAVDTKGHPAKDSPAEADAPSPAESSVEEEAA